MRSANRRSFRLRIASIAVFVVVLAGLITPPSVEALSRPAAKTIATGLSDIPCRYALLASKGTTAVVAYLNGETIKSRRSLNAGVTWESARTISLGETEGSFYGPCIAVVATSTYFYVVADTAATVQVDPACEDQYVDEVLVACETIDTSTLRFWRSADGKTWSQVRQMDSTSIDEFRVSATATQVFLAAYEANVASDCGEEDCPADTTTINVYESGANNLTFGAATELVTDVATYDDDTAMFQLGGGSIATLTWIDSEGTSYIRARSGARNWRSARSLGSYTTEAVSASSGKSIFVSWSPESASSFRWTMSSNSGSSFSSSKLKADSYYDWAQIRNVWAIGAKYGVAVYRWDSIRNPVTDIYTSTATSSTKRWSMRSGEICVGGAYVKSKVLVVARAQSTSAGDWVWDEDLEDYEWVEGTTTYSLYSYTAAP
jgi:hypothetical protein